MLELDVLLARYLERRYPIAPAAEQGAFEALLELQDPQLLSFVMGWDVPADPDLMNVVTRLASPDV
jgi:antitoxin CptB